MKSQTERGSIAVRTFLVAILTGSLAVAHAAISQLSVRPAAPIESDAIFVDVAFDAPVCVPGTSNPVAQLTSGPPATSVIQSRVDGQTISVVISATPSTSACTPANSLTVALPPLAAGEYTVRGADSAFGFSGILYGNNFIRSTASTAFTVAPNMPQLVQVFLQQGPFGTILSSSDAGAYQYFPTYASDLGRWQPVFYAWLYRIAEPNTQLQPIYALEVRIPGLTGRLFYTVDPKERAALVASSAFADVPSNSQYSAIAPTGGICPLGRVTIYRAFEPKALIHRYVPAATYRALLANGWKGDGVAFCVAAEPPGASSWAPN